jgi:hypothetical protein
MTTFFKEEICLDFVNLLGYTIYSSYEFYCIFKIFIGHL